jgi:hypothetical protein
LSKRTFQVGAYLLFLLLCYFNLSSGRRLDCCSKDYAANGVGCTAEGITYEGVTSFCVVHDSACSACLVSNSSMIHECVMCCVDDDSCTDTYVSDSSWGEFTTTLFSFALPLLLFVCSFDCCNIRWFMLLLFDCIHICGGEQSKRRHDVSGGISYTNSFSVC